MPELPEVETIVRNLRDGTGQQPSIVGRTIQGARFYWKRTLAIPSVTSFSRRIKGEVIESVGRRGKFIILSLSHSALLIHLRMSGDLRVEQEVTSNVNKAPNHAHDRMILFLDGHLRLAFNDARKFGRVWLTNDSCLVLNNLGPEPLSPELTPRLFYQMLASRRRQLKPLLLDQTFLAGLGNIYTDEALHLAGLHPLVLANKLSPRHAEKLLEAIRSVLQEGIKRNGASIDWVYRGGEFQNHFRVYQRTGEACPCCGSAVERITIGQRGTHFCPSCQPEELILD